MIENNKSKYVPELTSNLRNNYVSIPSIISKASGIRIFGKRLKSFIFTTDVAIIKNTNADAVIAVYPFTPQPTITQAILGAELEIPMCDGSKEKYKIPEGTQTGTKFSIRNKGFKTINGSSQGDFIFTVNVQTPKRLTKEQRELLVELAKTMNEQPPVKKKGIFG